MRDTSQYYRMAYKCNKASQLFRLSPETWSHKKQPCHPFLSSSQLSTITSSSSLSHPPHPPTFFIFPFTSFQPHYQSSFEKNNYYIYQNWRRERRKHNSPDLCSFYPFVSDMLALRLSFCIVCIITWN